MSKKIKNAVLYTCILMIAVAQVLFGMALFFGSIPSDSSLGIFFLLVSTIIWILLLFTGWKMTDMENAREIIFAVTMTACGTITITTAIIYIPILAQIAYILDIIIWAVVVCLTITDIFEY